MPGTKPLRGKRDKDPNDYPCYSTSQHRNSPKKHARNKGELGWPCPMHSINPIRIAPGYQGRFWTTVTGNELDLDLRTVWYLGERIEPVTDRTWGIFSRIW